MTDALQIITIRETSKNVWRLAFDGHVNGDSRGFDKVGAWSEARATVATDKRDAIKYDRPLIYTLGTEEAAL